MLTLWKLQMERGWCCNSGFCHAELAFCHPERSEGSKEGIKLQIPRRLGMTTNATPKSPQSSQAPPQKNLN
jgi:hypothetical protein